MTSNISDGPIYLIWLQKHVRYLGLYCTPCQEVAHTGASTCVEPPTAGIKAKESP